MSSLSHRTIPTLTGYVIGLSLVTALIFSLLPTITYGATIQEQGRIVTKLETPKAPVKVALVKTKKGDVEINKEFMDDDDWFKGLAVRVKNTSGKAITWLSIGLFFPRDKDYIPADPRDPMQTLPYSDSIGYGGSRIHMPDSPPVGLKPIAPSEHMDIELSDRQYLEIKTALAQISFPATIKKIEVRLEVVHFEDGMVWYAGAWFQRDPNNPKKLYLIDPDDPQKLIPIEPPPTPGGARAMYS